MLHKISHSIAAFVFLFTIKIGILVLNKMRRFEGYLQ
jgi:hypothetical protein